MNTPTTFNFSIEDVHNDFMVSREALGVTDRTYNWYQRNLGKYYSFLGAKGLNSISEACENKNINAFLASFRNQKFKGRELSDKYIHGFARCIKTLTRFAYEEKYISDLPKMKMPTIRKKKLPVLNFEEIQKLMDAAINTRDLALITLAISTGMRRDEIVNLNWGEVNLRKGKIDILEGKGKKYRFVFVDKQTLRVLIKHHTELSMIDTSLVSVDSPVIQTDEHQRIKPMGVRSIFIRLSSKSGVKFSAHALRRTFAKMAIKNGMDIIYLQSLMGHANLETTRDYVQDLDDEDIEKAYFESSPMKGIKYKK